MRKFLRTWPGRATLGVLAAGLLTLGAGAGSLAHAGADVTSTTFPLFANAKFLPCLTGTGTPKVSTTVIRGNNNDQMDLVLTGFKPNLAFDLFTVQRSSQLADGSANPTPGFGLAWYQSDIHVDGSGSAHVRINTILLDQIFGFDPDVSLAPTNTFNVGFWFNSPADAAPCGFTGTTPFNGSHDAGPLAFISRPSAVTGLGPLCTKPNTSNSPATCDG
jgi:hypothetical protein